MNPGSIVRCRNRDWVLLPSESDDLHLLRPLTGAMDDVVAINRRIADLIGYALPEERVRPATFPLPTADDLSDAAGAHLLWQAARLTLRDGATPFRSLGRISIRPRIYQFVPLLMALRLDPIRLLIADDVGVGKTIEALLIAREMLDRGEIKQICVLCPPYLCDQWQKELAEKANLEAVVIRSGTVGQLDRRKPASISIYRHFPVQVVSIDFVKSDRNRHLFLLDCPEFVIVDEAHGAAAAVDANASQQQRHRLLREIAAKEDRHLLLLTATPHSGIEAAFRSLLGLLRPAFAEWNTGALGEEQRIELARHFVQRTRRDIKEDWEGGDCFPDRDPADRTYRLSPAYRTLFARTHDFCSEIVRSGADLGKWQQRVRYWGALALLRSVMSSPAAAVAALEKRRTGLPVAEEEVDFSPFVFESADDQTDDAQPTPPLEAAETTLTKSERRKLGDLERLARSLHGSAADTKLGGCAQQVADLLGQGFHPIVWCRYIATADYVAEWLDNELRPLFPDLRVVSVSSRTGGSEERTAKIAELAAAPRRLLVATDCLSEGINLQEHFSAVLHYDLPWNPNRLEQREGRVDRYGRTGIVKAIRYFSPDSAVDGVVLDVLLNKAREIHKALGTYVPVPDDSETVTQAVLQALFLRRRSGHPDQLQLDLGLEMPRRVEELHRRWDRYAARERVNRTRFAQRALRPAEVRRELEATDAVLGDPEAVRNFVIEAAQRLGLALSPDKRADVFGIAVSQEATAALPEAIRLALPAIKTGRWLISFESPTPEGAEYLGRNHPFVAALARFLLEQALTKSGAAAASRCGVIRTRAVARLTKILLMRVRYLVEQPGRAPLLSEELLVTGFGDRAAPAVRAWLSHGEALRLLAEAKPDANVPMAEKRELVSGVLAEWPALEPALRERIAERGAELERSHKRVRQAVGLRVRELAVAPQLPPDLLGILVLQPLV
jgi:superfamily II DNA or RNA helicase